MHRNPVNIRNSDFPGLELVFHRTMVLRLYGFLGRALAAHVANPIAAA